MIPPSGWDKCSQRVDERSPLTLREISDTMSSWFAAVRDTSVAANRAASIKACFCTSMVDFGLRNVETRCSAVHGRGVFARDNIGEGMLVTFYPADVCVCRSIGTSLVMVPSARSRGAFDRMSARKRRQKFVHDSTYTVDIDTRTSFAGDPACDQDSNYLGHLINDASALLGKTQQDRQNYMRVSSLGANCRFRVAADGVLVAVEAIRDIHTDEELLVCYGLLYWQSQMTAYKHSHELK